MTKRREPFLIRGEEIPPEVREDFFSKFDALPDDVSEPVCEDLLRAAWEYACEHWEEYEGE